MNYISPVDNNRNQLELKTRKRRRHRDSIWQRPNGDFCHKTLVGTTNSFTTEEAAQLSKKNWQPYLSRLVRDGIMKKGDTILLKLSGANPFELQIKGINRSSLLFSVGEEVLSVGQVKKLVSKQLNRSPSSLNLNYSQSIHKPSGKSFECLRKDYKAQLQEQNIIQQEKNTQKSFDFLNIIGLGGEHSITKTKLNDELQHEYITNFRSDFKIYEEAQFNILSTMQTLSKETIMDCYRDSLIMFLNNTKINKTMG